jgi:hypothetical protein
VHTVHSATGIVRRRLLPLMHGSCAECRYSHLAAGRSSSSGWAVFHVKHSSQFGSECRSRVLLVLGGGMDSIAVSEPMHYRRDSTEWPLGRQLQQSSSRVIDGRCHLSGTKNCSATHRSAGINVSRETGLRVASVRRMSRGPDVGRAGAFPTNLSNLVVDQLKRCSEGRRSQVSTSSCAIRRAGNTGMT